MKADANAVGFLVGLTHLAEDKIHKDDAKAIIAQLPPFVSSVLVTHLTDRDEIIALATELRVNTIQIHDYMSPADIIFVRKKMANCKIIKAIHIIDEAEAIQMMHDFEYTCDALLLDSRTKGRLGGTGLVHDWNISKHIVSESKIPVILAGGLTEKNVFDAVKKTMPFGVDVNSGVETDGWKNYAKVKEFISEAHRAEWI